MKLIIWFALFQSYCVNWNEEYQILCKKMSEFSSLHLVIYATLLSNYESCDIIQNHL